MIRTTPKKYMTKSRKKWRVSKAMSALGRIGGQTRAEKLSPEERRASAIKASQAAAKARSEKAAERQRNTEVESEKWGLRNVESVRRATSSRRASRPPFKHDLRAWLLAFANQFRPPFTALLNESCEVNPYFIVFTLYWYRVPCQTRHELSVNKASRVAAMATKTIRRLAGVAEDLGSLHQSMRFKDPFRYQIREHLNTDGLYDNERPPFDPMIDQINKCSEQLKSLRELLKNLASMKRNPRVSLEVLLWLHLVGTVGISETRRLFPHLVHAADAAFNQESRAIDVAGAIEQAVGRFANLFPAEYERLKGKALRNKIKLTSEEVRYWKSPSRHHKIIASYLDDMFDKETAHAQGIWRPAPHETAQQ